MNSENNFNDLDDVEDLERDLKRLSPAPVPPSLRQRIASRIPSVTCALPRSISDRPRNRVLPISFGILTAAAVFTMVFSLMERDPKNPSPDPDPAVATPGDHPAQMPSTDTVAMASPTPPPEIPGNPSATRAHRANRYLVGVHEEGLVYSTNRMPFRRFRTEIVDTMLLSDAGDPVTVRVYVPRDEWMFVPVAAY